MKKSTLIIFGSLTLLALLALAYYFFSRKTPAPEPTDNTQFPITGQAGSDTGQVVTKDNVLANPQVHADANNPGTYTIGYVAEGEGYTGEEPYQISYIAETNYFNVTLTVEPLGQSRSRAESYLMQQLKITKEEMCSLNYGVYTPNSVNDQYAGTNLGFSFCPGAVKLP